MKKNKNIAFILLGLFIIVFALLLVLQSSKFSFFGQKLTIACPVPKESCKKGIPLYKKNGQLLGIGFSLPVNTPLSAAFSGNLREGAGLMQKSKQYYFVVIIEGKDKLADYTAIYEFYGTPIYGMEPEKLKSGIKEKELAGYLGPDTFPNTNLFKGVNFVFSLHKGAKTTPPLPLNAFEFK